MLDGLRTQDAALVVASTTLKSQFPIPIACCVCGEDKVMPEDKLKFVNGEDAQCGCKLQFSDGGGDFSDVHTVTLCTAHQAARTFGPVEVRRDADGWWFHPGIPDFGGDEDPAPYIAWMAEQGLERKGWHMEDELNAPEEHPYCSGGCHCNGWDPQSPGLEWFLTGIFDTEDGPYVSWARRVVTP